MSYDVTSWYVDQLQLRASAPVRQFTIGSSDYSDRVVRWPKFSRYANRIIASKATVTLANDDGLFNNFHERVWTLPNTCSVLVGYTHANSGDETVSIFSGDIKEVRYPKKSACELHLRDRLWALTEKKIGTSDEPVELSSQVPSDIAWTICTCYGELDNTESAANPHIDWESFNVWAENFSSDNIVMAAYYNGIKVAKALGDLGDMTDSAIWTEGDGRLYFRRYTEPSSLDFTLVADDILDVNITVDGMNLVNKAWVYGLYSTDSDYWQIATYMQESTSVNTFGLHETTWKNKNIWYVDSASCQNMAQRKALANQYPPRKFKLSATVVGLYRQLGETIRFVDTFYNINSGTGWRFDEMKIDTDKFRVDYKMNEATAGDAFFLDVDVLDGDKLLL